jgi:hypothetical protein
VRGTGEEEARGGRAPMSGKGEEGVRQQGSGVWLERALGARKKKRGG